MPIDYARCRCLRAFAVTVAVDTPLFTEFSAYVPPHRARQGKGQRGGNLAIILSQNAFCHKSCWIYGYMVFKPALFMLTRTFEVAPMWSPF